MSGDDGLREAAGVLYPGLFPDDALRLHPVQIQRTAEWVAALRAKADAADLLAARVLRLADEMDRAGSSPVNWYVDRLRRVVGGPHV